MKGVGAYRDAGGVVLENNSRTEIMGSLTGPVYRNRFVEAPAMLVIVSGLGLREVECWGHTMLWR